MSVKPLDLDTAFGWGRHGLAVIERGYAPGRPALLLAVAPAPLALAAAFAPSPAARMTAPLAAIVLVTGMIGQATRTGLFYIFFLPALAAMIVAAVRLCPRGRLTTARQAGGDPGRHPAPVRRR